MKMRTPVWEGKEKEGGRKEMEGRK
jgi:hypothetical protein